MKPLWQAIKEGQIGVLLTDTIYGLVGVALNKNSVERIYKVRKRSPQKPCIILIGQVGDLEKFNIKISSEEKKILSKLWPGELSIIFEVKEKKFEYLHRGTDSLAFRLPKNHKLTKLLKLTGPLVAPSANPEGKNPAKTITAAYDYFGESVDFYSDDGPATIPKPSTVVKLNMPNKSIKVLRKGRYTLKNLRERVDKTWKVLVVK